VSEETGVVKVPIMPNIFQYLNYREYLEDFYDEKKNENDAFSYQNFANRAGFKSKSFIKLVIDGKKNLSPESATKINNVLKLSDKAFSYFNDLVAFSQAKTLQLRNYYFERLSSYNRRNKARLIQQQQYELFSKWYHSTVREIVQHARWNGDYARLGRLLKPNLTARKARQSVELLLKLGLIRKTSKDTYEQTDPISTTGDEVQSLAVQNFHAQNLALATASIDSVERSSRDISCLVLGLSENGIQTVKSEIQKFRKKLLEIAEGDAQVLRVYHVSFQMFPTSEVLQHDVK
jgi:uncharacterized protein (TIGR02147 family)